MKTRGTDISTGQENLSDAKVIHIENVPGGAAAQDCPTRRGSSDGRERGREMGRGEGRREEAEAGMITHE